MEEITIIIEVTNKKHSDNYKYLIDQSNEHNALGHICHHVGDRHW